MFVYHSYSTAVHNYELEESLMQKREEIKQHKGKLK